MKKLFITALLASFAFNAANAQESTTVDDTSFTKFQLRVRALAVVPNESATIDAIGGDVTIANDYVPELDLTYFFTKNIAAELILATTQHDVKAISTAAGDIPLGDVRLLPPTLTLQYHFNSEMVHPYVGAGVNYTLFYDANSGPVADEVEYDNAFGLAFQLGFDFDITDKWFVNIDAKYVLLNTDVTVDATTALGATVGADVDIDPFIAGIGIGYRLF
ncbi:outer membrane beta-barrel protein [Lacinutrix sp. C3R15]|uniref:OmpW/AlkL family protein n=1 Tax=Flavobacteriaceae TaxID=49546 RepID=UPI001C09A196|nr:MULTISPECIES: OmpW family outer membrane protein [Flavobacteriaceae]MBU2940594.1 outer membrane beta-barrel protein [Lacinutrix sp. C3R15]MDO6623912.1 OmpW family outer membrane protein [Oceanihabitans sp. 1_MG-2023]